MVNGRSLGLWATRSISVSALRMKEFWLEYPPRDFLYRRGFFLLLLFLQFTKQDKQLLYSQLRDFQSFKIILSRQSLTTLDSSPSLNFTPPKDVIQDRLNFIDLVTSNTSTNMCSTSGQKKVNLQGGESSSRGHRHHSSKGTGAKYVYCWTWACCSCGRQGGMTTEILNCPDVYCAHLRCENCPLEQVKTLASR
jgi:hypothetical protein